MDIVSFFQAVRKAVEEASYEGLAALQLDKPEPFNWVEDIFFPLNVAPPPPQSPALLWRYGDREHTYSFREIYDLSNRLLNFLRRHGCAAGDRLYTVLPLVPENWISFLATIKGGFIIMPTATNLTGSPLKPGSMGRPTFLYEVGIYAEAGKALPPLEEGIICVKTQGARPNGLFLEYLQDAERTSRVFRHGLYYTGDKAYKDEEGYIWFAGRNDDVIKASAYRIGPLEVESVLIEHSDIVESAVVASPHELRGYAVKAFVILRPGAFPTKELAEDIFAFTESKLAGYTVPRIIEFVEELPKTISGKIRRVELRSHEANERLSRAVKPYEYFHAKY